MADTFKKLYQGQLPAAAATVYTAPAAAGNAAIVKVIRVANTSNASQTFTLYQSGTGVANQITGTIGVGPGETFVDTGPLVLGAGDTIAAVASAATSLTLTLAGLEIT